ncbi:MAG: hypothetical protein J5659_02915 [Clostridia bacterium]|nr:hypothetical protein [Clostridia bacterium]
MKLFDDFEVVKFYQENLFFVTDGGYIYYVYNPKYDNWRKYRCAGNDSITVKNYDEVSKEELIDAMKGVFPKKETDFMRLCSPSQLCIRDMLDLLGEDYPQFMSDGEIYHTVHRFLLDSDICEKSYTKLRDLFDSALSQHLENAEVVEQVKALSLSVIGRDIFKREIGIVDGHDSSSYFWIMPVRVVDYSDTNGIDTIAEMRSIEISIEEDDVAQYLTPFLYKYFDQDLEANKWRDYQKWVDEDGTEHTSCVEGFEWYLTHNFYTYEAMAKILTDINDTIDALSTGRDNEYTAKLREKRGTATYELLYAKNLTDEQVKAYNDNRPTEDDTEIDLIIDFYRRLVYRLEYMMKVGKEKGYDLISFMGP